MMNESSGATLRQVREQRHLTVQQVSEQTRIRSHYVQALENDDLAAMPSLAQARGFLRIYADFLGLDSSKLIAAGPAVDSAASTLPSSTTSQTDNQDTAPSPKTSPPGLLSVLRDLWLRRGPGNGAGAPQPDAVASDASDARETSAGPSTESRGGETRPQALPRDIDEVKKKLN